MDILGGRNNKKLWIIIGVSLFFIIVVTLGILFSTGTIDIRNTDDDMDETSSGDWQANNGTDNKNPTQFDPNPELDYERKNEAEYTGSILSYTDYSTYAELELEEDGETRLLTLYPSTVVFDADTNSVVIPSKIRQADSIRIISAGKNDRGEEVVSTAFLGNSQGLEHAYITDIEIEGNKTKLVSTANNTEYYLSVDVESRNALTGVTFPLEDLIKGDRVFVYTNTVQEEGSKKKVTVNSIYVYPMVR